jgi:ATP-binding cassette subfamily C exporter for protease/lipase
VAEGVTAVAPGTQLPILRNVSFAALPGEVLVVVGPSASGKTTLARLLTGVWLAAAGKVRLDGVDVHSWNKDELGPYVGYVPQDVELFDGTLAENIARFGKVDIEQVQASVALVGLNALLASLPDGLDTRIGDDGAVLSGGQRQRVALARALYGMPRLLVLDEPNSSLDDAGDEALNHTLRRLKAAGTTIIVMSHRTSILPVADRMLVLRDGAVALFGPRDEVLAALQRSVSQAGQPGTSQAQTKPPLPATAAVAP